MALGLPIIPDKLKGDMDKVDELLKIQKTSVSLTDGDIRFILWAIPQADTWTNEGMRYYSRTSDYRWMIERLRNRLPENNNTNQ